jgi:DNA-binding PucR family transcriptional regulator
MMMTKIKNYIIVTKGKTSNKEFLNEFAQSLFVKFTIEDLETAFVIQYSDDVEESIINEAFTSYLFDACDNVIVYIGRSFVNDADSDIKTILRLLSYSLTKPLYHKKSLVEEVIDNKDEDVKKLVLNKYYLDYSMQDLLKTFFINNMNTLKSSKVLYIHRNTLINKIQRFKEDTGFDPKEFRDAYLIYSLIK